MPPPAAAAAAGAGPPFAARGPSADRATPPMVAQAGHGADATNANRAGADSDSDVEFVAEVERGAEERPGRRAPDPLRGMRWCLDADQLTHLLWRAGSRRPAGADGGSPGGQGAIGTGAEGGLPRRPSSCSLGSGGTRVANGAPAAARAPKVNLRLRTSGDGREAGAEGWRPGLAGTGGNTAGRTAQEPASQQPHVTHVSDVVGSEFGGPWDATLRKRADAVAQARAAAVAAAVQAAVGAAAAGAAAGAVPPGGAGSGIAVPDPVELPSPELVQQLTEEWLDRSVLALLQQHIVGMGDAGTAGDGQAGGAERDATHPKAVPASAQQQQQQQLDKEARRQWFQRVAQAWRDLPFDNRRTLYVVVCRLDGTSEAGPAAGAGSANGAAGGPGATGGDGGAGGAGSRLGSWYILEHLARCLDVAHGVLSSAAPATAAPVAAGTQGAARALAVANGPGGVGRDGGEGGRFLMLQRLRAEARAEGKA